MYEDDDIFVPFENRFIKLENRWFRIIDKEKRLFEIIDYNYDAFYLLVNMLTRRTIANTICFNRQYISKVFGRDSKGYIDDHFTNKAIKALEVLIEKEILISDKDINSFDFRTDNIIDADVNLPFLNVTKDFFNLYHNQLKIINECKNVDRAKLLSVYCTIRSHIFEGEVGYRTLEAIIKDTKLAKNTVNKYLGVLKDLGLIIYKSPGTRYFENSGKYKEAPNFFTYPSVEAEKNLEEEILDYIEKQKEKGIAIIFDRSIKKRMNERRSNTSKRKKEEQLFQEDKISKDRYKNTIQECDDCDYELLAPAIKTYLEFHKPKEQTNEFKVKGENIPDIDEEFLVDDEIYEWKAADSENRSESKITQERYESTITECHTVADNPFADVEEVVNDYEDELEEIERLKARERMSDGGKGKELFPDLQGQTRDIVAEKVVFEAKDRNPYLDFLYEFREGR